MAARVVPLAAVLATASGNAAGAEPPTGGAEREQSVALVGGIVALTLSAHVELQTRWGR